VKKHQLDYRFFVIPAVLLLALLAPSLLGKYCGHGWGLLMASADIVGWFYINIKYFSKKRLALSTHAIWLLILAGLIVVTIFELTHLHY
jgi:hypothetical protein